MAANKFATLLHKSTNRITLILAYALLEWILIVLLLLNSLFSYLIIKFADYFSLKRPCLWCSRLDHIFEPSKYSNSYRDLVCDDHAGEISRLGYCSNHRKLAESQDMCGDCLSSSRSGCCDLSKKLAFSPLMKQVGSIQDGEDGDRVVGNSEENFKCSCCGVLLEKKWNFPYMLIKPSWDVLDYPQKGNLIADDGGFADVADEGNASDGTRSDVLADYKEDEQRVEENNRVEILSDGDEDDEGVKGGELGKEEFSCFISSFDCNQMAANVAVVVKKDLGSKEEEGEQGDLNESMEGNELTRVASNKDESPEIQPNHLEFYIEGDDCHLIPVELMDSVAVESQRYSFREEEQGIGGNGDVILDFDLQSGTPLELVLENSCNSREKVKLISPHESENVAVVAAVEPLESKEMEKSFSTQAREEDEQVASTQANLTPLMEADEVYGNAATGEDVNQVIDEQNDEIEAEISIGTDIPDHEPIEDIQMQLLFEFTQEDPSTSSSQLHVDAGHGSENAEEETIQFKTMTVETCDQAVKNHLSVSSELNEIEDDKVLDIPTSIDSIHQKKLPLLEKSDLGTEDSLDASVFSEVECADGVLTVEKLKSALKAERKALNTLYTELEEERSASAVAASQTMAMINRLQEEKAAMQMEALQYQRMMEEQSEYDQEALQLMNELMVKREREKVELEKELEIFRKRVQDYETREKMILRRRRNDDSTRSATSASCSNAEDSDGPSVDLNHEPKEEDSFGNHQEDSNQNTPADAVLYLEESLACFEEERLSILEQLKVLEEKLVSLNDEDEHFEDVKSLEYLYKENGNGFYESFDIAYETNGIANGHFEGVNGKHHQEKNLMAATAKRLLPLFDATEAEIKNGILNGHENGFDSVALQLSSPANSELESKRLAIEEEVDHVYERLQALEADREFLKHCVSSLRKGDKGIYLLQEILQHLRDLRSVELRVRSIGDAVI